MKRNARPYIYNGSLYLLIAVCFTAPLGYGCQSQTGHLLGSVSRNVIVESSRSLQIIPFFSSHIQGSMYDIFVVELNLVVKERTARDVFICE